MNEIKEDKMWKCKYHVCKHIPICMGLYSIAHECENDDVKFDTTSPAQCNMCQEFKRDKL